MGAKCQICNYDKCQEAIELHHINPEEKDATISSMVCNPKRWKNIASELTKCILLCNRCHRELHCGLTELPKKYKKYAGELEEFYIKKIELIRQRARDICPICAKIQIEKVQYMFFSLQKHQVPKNNMAIF